MWNNHIAKALPSINPQQFAAKTILKDQQPLVLKALNNIHQTLLSALPCSWSLTLASKILLTPLEISLLTPILTIIIHANAALYFSSR